MRHPTRHKNSSVACFECRKKKQKCIGGDENTACASCIKNSTRCQIDASTDGRRRWHTKVKESRSQQRLLENLLDTIRSGPAARVEDLLSVIRSGASLEEVQGFVDDTLALRQSPMAEEGESSTGRNTSNLRSPTHTEASGSYHSSSNNSNSNSIEQSLRAHRDLLGSISASMDLPDHLARQLESLLAHSPEQHDSRMEMHRNSYDGGYQDPASPASGSHYLSHSGSVHSNPSLEDAELLSQFRSVKSTVITSRKEVSIQEIQPVLPPIQLLDRYLPPPFQRPSSGITHSYGQEQSLRGPHFLLPPLQDRSEPSGSSTFFQHTRNQ